MTQVNLDIQITDQDLPVLSAVATQSLDLLNDPMVTNRRLEELIRQDPSLTERVLRTANSPFYGARRPSNSISEAIFRVGLRQIHTILIVAATGELFSAKDPVIQTLWKHATVTALTCNFLAERLKVAHREEAFISGMLHDVGQMVIYRQHPVIYGQMMEESQRTQRQILELENERFQYFNHMTVGGLVIRKWGLSDCIAECARFHHELEREVPANLDLSIVPLASIVSLAENLVSNLGYGVPAYTLDEIPSLACARHLWITREKVDALCANLSELIEQQQFVI